ncbi:MAG: hypothetical protein H6581_22865 [Bacteroidia bacterium]|nr:hypothetical protein [Bacteroidia bacterium]
MKTSIPPFQVKFALLALFAGLFLLPLPLSAQVSVFDVIAGNFAHHSPAYYAHIIAELEPRQAEGKLTAEGAAFLSEAYVRNGQADKGIALYRQFMEEKPRTDQSADSLHLGRLYGMAGDYDRYIQLSGPPLATHSKHGINRSWNLQMRYLDLFLKTPEGPVFAGFNGGFGNFVDDSLPPAPGQALETVENMQNMIRRIAEDGPDNPVLYEMLGDLLYQDQSGDEMRYLAAFAYQRASQLATIEEASNAYRRKAAFAMEGEVIRDPNFFNKVRYANFEQAFLTQQKAAQELQERIEKDETAWAAQGKDMEIAFLDAYGPFMAPSYPDYKPDYWPKEKGEALAFVSKEVENENNRRTFTPNDDVTNPSLDLKAVKRDYRFNFYALIVFAFIIGAVAIIWRNFRKMEKLRDEKEG